MNATKFRSAYVVRVIVAIAWTVFVIGEAIPAYVRHGDATEYVVTTEAWLNHGSPVVRDEDRRSMLRLPGEGLDAQVATVKSRDDSTYTLHFWLYSLLCVPAKVVLRLFHANELKAFAVTNAIAFAAAVCIAWSWGSAVAWRRRTFVVLAAIGPAFWYIHWSSPETVSWAAVVVALAMIDRKRYAIAAAMAGVGALQNPPIALLALACVLIAWVSTRRMFPVAMTALGASVSLGATLFYVVTIGAASPILKTASSPALVSTARTVSLLLDANQGLLPFAPLLVLSLPVAIAYVVRRRDCLALAVTASLVGMIFSVQIQKNWNAGCAGIIRYGVWMLPVLAWLVIRALPNRRRTLALLFGELAWQGATVVANFDAREDYLEHHAIARLFLDHAPSLYNPDPEIFSERTLHSEFEPNELADVVPIAYERADGEITKLLVTPEAFSLVRKQYEIRPDYEPIFDHRAGDGPLAVFHYVDPPKGAIRRSFPPMRVIYEGCDELAPDHHGRICEADSRLAVRNLGRGPGHIKLEAMLDRTSTLCALDIDVERTHEQLTVDRATRYQTVLIVPATRDVWLHFSSSNGARHVIRDVAIVRADAP